MIFAVWYGRRLVSDRSLWAERTPTATPAQIDDAFIWLTLGVVLGGRIGYVLFYNFPHFLAQPLDMFRVWEGGMSFHGGFLGVVIALVIYARKIGTTLDRLLDLGAHRACRAWSWSPRQFHQWRTLWAAADMPWAMVFPSDPAGLPRHPSQLYEALLEGLVLFLAVRIATHRFQALAHPGRASGYSHSATGFRAFWWKCSVNPIRNWVISSVSSPWE